MSRRLLGLGVAALLLALPSAASGHAVIRIEGGILNYDSEDAASANRLEIRGTVAGVTVYDPGNTGGMQAPSTCRPGRTDDRGSVHEFHCPAAGLREVRIDVGPNEDTTFIDGPWTTRTVGAAGADDLRSAPNGGDLDGGQGNDVLRGADGPDVLQGGHGADTVDAGGGDDLVTSADGVRDVITCGAGGDTVRADTVDEVAIDCEVVERTYVAPPSYAARENDRRAPRLKIRRTHGSVKRVKAKVRSSERGEVTASGFLKAGGLNSALPTVTRQVRRRRATVALKLRLDARQRRRVRRDLSRGRRPRARIVVAATDAAGNTRTRRATVRVR